jgi:ribosomal-protein-alanine N-acetyltransferase
MLSARSPDLSSRRLPDRVPVIPVDKEIVLRPLALTDAVDWHAYLSDPEVTELTSIGEPSLRDIENVIQGYIDGFTAETSVRWAIAPGADAKIIGDCGFNHFDFRNDVAVIGYVISRPYWGHGIATSAVGSMLRWGFEQLGLNRIEATINPDNARSIRVAEKLGFTREGRLRDYRRMAGGFRDCYIYGLLRREWRDP